MKKKYYTPKCDVEVFSNADCIMLSLISNSYSNSGDDLELWEY